MARWPDFLSFLDNCGDPSGDHENQWKDEKDDWVDIVRIVCNVYERHDEVEELRDRATHAGSLGEMVPAFREVGVD